jgi:hypothetical protein
VTGPFIHLDAAATIGIGEYWSAQPVTLPIPFEQILPGVHVGPDAGFCAVRRRRAGRIGKQLMSRIRSALGFLQKNGANILREVLINLVLPYLIYSLTETRLGEVNALIASSAPPILWSIVEFARNRRVDVLSIFVLLGIGLSLLAFFGGGSAKFLQLREKLVTAFFALLFLGSAAIGRPLIDLLAQARMRRGAPEKAAALEALREDAGFRAALTLATLVWGVGLLAVCAVNCALVFVVSIKTYLLIGGPISYGAIGLMSAWTFWYMPRVRRQVEVRLVAAASDRS